MKISRSSWHFWLVEKFFNYPSRSLCVYFWQLVWSIIVGTIVLAIMLLAFTVIIALPSFSIFNLLFLDFDLAFKNETFYEEMHTLGILCSAVILFFAVIFGSVFSIAYGAESLSESKTGEKIKSNIFVQYIRAKKSKVCPRIEYED